MTNQTAFDFTPATLTVTPGATRVVVRIQGNPYAAVQSVSAVHDKCGTMYANDEACAWGNTRIGEILEAMGDKRNAACAYRTAASYFCRAGLGIYAPAANNAADDMHL